jgi:hypothetical protein
VPRATFDLLAQKGLKVRRPERTYATLHRCMAARCKTSSMRCKLVEKLFVVKMRRVPR